MQTVYLRRRWYHILRMVHIGEEKDFTPVIEKALELGGYEEDREFTGINGGNDRS